MIEKIRKFVNPAPVLWSWVKTYQKDIVLVFGVILISLISFSVGYVVARDQLKGKVQVEESYGE
ncbi:MAG: hypothetical protein O3C23_02075 [bacterium]|nr:hypothetical protein [bacterium]